MFEWAEAPEDSPGMTDDTVTLEGTCWHPELPVRLGVLDDDARFAFTHGQCHAFAIALVEVIGGEFVWAGKDECDGLADGWGPCEGGKLPSGICACQVYHLFVQRDEEYLDVYGAHDAHSLLEEEYEVLCPLGGEDLAAICAHEEWRRPALAAARALVPTYLQWLGWWDAPGAN